MSGRGMGVHQILESLNGRPGTPTTQALSTTAVSKTLTAGKRYILQSDVDVYVNFETTATAGVSGNGIKILVDEKFYFQLKDTETSVSLILSSGTGTAKFFPVE